MTAEQQLERSVLEGKERDELSAIAQAMSLKTTTRTKKADIIDQILDATGVTSGPAAAASNGDGEPSGTNGAPKPARRSRASAAARGAAETASFVSGDDDDSRPATGDAEDGPASQAIPAAGTTEVATNGDSGPAVFVEPPELADGADPSPRQNGQSQSHNNQNNGGGGQQGNRNQNRNQGNQNRNQNQNLQNCDIHTEPEHRTDQTKN